MFCIKCGADNLETASFCRKCGAAIVEEEETRVAARKVELVAEPRNRSEPDSPEAVVFEISPTLLFVKAGYVASALGALLVVAIFSMFFTSVPAWIAVIIGLLLLLIPAFFHVKQKMIRYTLTDSKLEIDEGFIARKMRSVPIRRIQDVTVAAGVTQRLLGFGDLMIDNASDEGGKIVLKNIDKPKHYADVLLRQMRRLGE